MSLLAHSLGHCHPCALPPRTETDILGSIYWQNEIVYLFIFKVHQRKKDHIWLHQIFVVALRVFSCGIWDLVPRPVIEPQPPALGARSLGPPGKSQNEIILKSYKFGEHALLLPGNFIPQHLNKNVTVDTLFEGTYKLLASVKH